MIRGKIPPNYPILPHILVFMMGTIIGSFLNVCIYRIPKKQSIVLPGSYCPKCKHSIKWYDNIPVLSFLLLAGKCGYCRGKIPFQYIVVELLTAMLMLGLYVSFGFSPKFFAYAFMTCGLIVVGFIDLATYEIPDGLSLGGIIAGFIFALALPAIFDTPSRGLALLASVEGMLVGGGAIYLMGALGGIMMRREAMGGGDVKLMAAIGAFLGWKLTLLTFFVAPVFGAAIGLVAKARDGKEVIPYGPFLSLAAIIALFFGDKILQFLLNGFYQ